MKVSEAIKSFPGYQLGYVRRISYKVAGDEAEERTLDQYRTDEMMAALECDCIAYYTIGAYCYIIYKEG